MIKANYHVDKLNNNHKDKIERIWRNSLPDNLKSIIGLSIIKNYLEVFFKNKQLLGVGIFKSDELIGFVLFGNDNYILKKIIQENLFKILLTFSTNLFTLNIKNLNRYINVFFFMIFSKNKEVNLKKNNTELLIIAVKKSENNKGLGSQLINETLRKYKNFFSDFNNVLVKTLTSTPQNIKFYEKNDFKIETTFFGRIYLKREINK